MSSVSFIFVHFQGGRLCEMQLFGVVARVAAEKARDEVHELHDTVWQSFCMFVEMQSHQL